MASARTRNTTSGVLPSSLPSDRCAAGLRGCSFNKAASLQPRSPARPGANERRTAAGQWCRIDATCVENKRGDKTRAQQCAPRRRTPNLVCFSSCFSSNIVATSHVLKTRCEEHQRRQAGTGPGSGAPRTGVARSRTACRDGNRWLVFSHAVVALDVAVFAAFLSDGAHDSGISTELWKWFLLRAHT